MKPAALKTQVPSGGVIFRRRKNSVESKEDGLRPIDKHEESEL